MGDFDERWRDYESSIEDVDEIHGTDVKINPDFYVHQAIANAQKALNEPNLPDAYVRFRMWVEHVQDLAVAAKMVTEAYWTDIAGIEEALKKEMGPEGWAKMPENARSARMASRKLQFLLKQIFATKTKVAPLKL